MEVYGHRKRVCTESRLWEKDPHRGLEPVLGACRSDAVSTELHPSPHSLQNNAQISEVDFFLKQTNIQILR